MEQASDPAVDGPRHRCYLRVRHWLRSQDSAAVLSQTSYNDSGGGGRPDSAYDAAATEADLAAALERLPELHRVAGHVSRQTERDQGWFRLVAEPRLFAELGNRWLEWMWHVENTRGQGVRPFEALLDEAAEMITDDLGAGWW